MDLRVLPTFHKRCLSAVFAAFLGLFAAAPAHAASAPKIKAAYAFDGDRDGHVDGVSLKWSTRVRGGFDADEPIAGSVRGSRVSEDRRLAREDAARCIASTLSASRAASRVRLHAPRTVPVRTTRGKRAARSHKLDMRRFDLGARESPARSRSTPTAMPGSTASA